MSAVCTNEQYRVGIYGRWPNASTGHDKVIVVAHAPDGLDDFTFIIRDDFNALQLDPECEAVFGKEGGVGVNRLWLASCCVNIPHPSQEPGRALTFPPRTSSPMIKHAAVCIVLVALTIAGEIIVDGMRRRGESVEDKGLVAAGEKLRDGRDRWRVS